MVHQSSFALNIDAPLTPPPTVGSVGASILRGIKELILALDGDPIRVLERAGIDPAVVDDPYSYIECHHALKVLDYCSSALKDPLFGVHLAERQDPDVYGCAITAARTAPDVEKGLQSFIDYLPLSSSPEGVFEMVTSRAMTELRWRTRTVQLDSEHVECQCALLITKLLRMLGRERFRPTRASFVLKLEPERLRTLESRIGCPISSNAAYNSILFSSDMLKCPLPTADRMTYSLLKSYMSRLKATSADDLTSLVEDYIRRAIPNGHCSKDDCARALGISVRTLHRRLADDDASFSDLLCSARIELAKHALKSSQSNLDEIAYRLGYSDQSSFGRSFKSATGLSPRRFRLS